MTANRLMGFAALKLRDPDYQRAIARRGGQHAADLGRSHRYTKEEASAASLRRRCTRKHPNDVKCILRIKHEGPCDFQ